MTGRKLSLQPAATGLVIANLVVIGVAIACLLVARRAWQLREDALTALAEARADAASAPRAFAGTVRAAVHAPLRKLRASTMDRMLLFGVVGCAASAFFTWRLVTRSRAPARLEVRRGASRSADRWQDG
jgi:hypothetical protein